MALGESVSASPSLSRQLAGAAGGPLIFATVYLTNPFGIEASANAALAVTLWIVVWWVTEPVHLAVTSLLPIPLYPLVGVIEVETATTAYAHPIVFLLLGGFLLALAVERADLHVRIAGWFVTAVGETPTRLLLAVVLVSGFLSMWISNTATVMLLVPIVLAIVAPNGADVDFRGGFPLAMLLGVAYGATIGGAATLIGSTPSALFAGIAGAQFDIAVGFLDWMTFAVPIVVPSLFVAWLGVRFLVGGDWSQGVVKGEHRSPGPIGSDERRVAAVFGLVIAAWLSRPFVLEPLHPAITDPLIAVAGGAALFLLPRGPDGEGERLLSWDDTVDMPWDVLVLIGGSLAVAEGFVHSGLDGAIADALSGLAALPPLALVGVVVVAVVTVSNVMSNTAATTVFLPVLAGIAAAGGLEPTGLMAPAALAASFVFVLPVSTPPNAIVYGTGELSIPDMARVGIVLNLIMVVVVAVLAYLWLPVVDPFG